MKKIIVLSIFLCNFAVAKQYRPTSPYLQYPALSIGYVDTCARFWLQTWDNQRGGFFTNIARDGSVLTSWGTNKNMLTQTRNAYGLVRAYMLTSDTTYLGYAKRALEWMYAHAWDTTYGGWYQDLDINGTPMYPYQNKTAFYQHYALLGITAYYEATRDTTAWNWLMKGYQHLENYYWDNRAGLEGYYDATDYNHQNRWDKSFNATVDAITTHLLYLYLMTKNPIYEARLKEIAKEMKIRLVASMPQQAIGFVEKYDSDWNWNNNYTQTLMGHVLKTGWCLARVNQLFPDTSYVSAAQTLMTNVWQKGYDHQYGGPYKDYNRVTGQMLLWGLPDSTKAWWQMEQAIVGGLQMYNVTGEGWYLRMVDETLNFFMTYFVDHQYGEVYADRTRYGGLAWNDMKASNGKAGYHSIETGYYTYLYGNLFYQYQEDFVPSVILHYNFQSQPNNRTILLTPLAIKDGDLMISGILLNGQTYSNYNSTSRVLTLPAGVGGHFQVTYRKATNIYYGNVTPPDNFPKKNTVVPQEYSLSQNYPNPFNPTTKIQYQLPTTNQVTLKVYDVLGKEIATLVNEQKEAGSYTATFDASSYPSGMYFYKIQAGNYTDVKKMVVMK